jgi:hypothetical protein
MVIADDLTYTDLYAALQKAENILRRPVNPTVLSIRDWRRKVSTKGSVIAKISAQPKLFIFGSGADLQHDQKRPCGGSAGTK